MGRSTTIAVVMLVSGIVSVGIHGSLAAPGYEGPTSDHFDGRRFTNEAPFEERNLFHVLKWRLTSEPKPWPDWVELPRSPPPPERVEDGVRVTFVNHATTLIQIRGVNILTDPVWSEKAGPFSWAGSRRHKAPGIAFEDLPPIDAILISHNHFDHLDLPTLARLAERGSPVVYAGLGTKKLLEKNDVTVAAVDLDWWQSGSIRTVEITFAPAQHWSTRALISDQNVTLWGSWYVSSGEDRVYFAGDTATGPHFAKVRDRLGAPSIALLPIGAYEPRWFMKPQHINPAEAVDAHLTLGAQKSVAIHWGTFQQTDEAMDDPPAELAKAIAAANLGAETFLVLENGLSLSLP